MFVKFILLNSGLNEEQANHFLEWSFGPKYKTYYLINHVKAWNKLHGNLLIINKSDEINYSLKKMYDIYYKLNNERIDGPIKDN